MLLLLNRRYPAIGAVLSLAADGAFIAVGAAAASPLLIVTGAASVALSIGRTAARRRRASTAQAHQ